MSKLRLSPAASITPTDTGVLLRSDLGTFQLQGSDVRIFLTDMTKLLDGSRDAETVADDLPDYGRSSVLSFLELLRQKGLIEDVAAPGTAQAETDPTAQEAGPRPEAAARWAPQERFFRAWTPEATEGSRRLDRVRLLVIGLEPWGVAAVRELAAAGIGHLHLLDSRDVTDEDLLSVRGWRTHDVGTPRRDALAALLAEEAPWCRVRTGSIEVADDTLSVAGGPWDLLLTGLTADDLYVLQRAARFAHRSGLPSLYGHLDGVESWVGPGVIPGETPCWNCFRLRRLGHADVPKPAHDLDGALLAEPHRPRARALLAPMAALAGHELAIETLKLVGGFTNSRLIGRVLVHNQMVHDADYHTVIRMPWCEVCGGAAETTRPAGGALDDLPDASEVAAPPEGRRARVDDVHDVDGLRQLLAGWVDERVGVIRSLTGAAGDLGTMTLPLTGSAVLAHYTEGKLPHSKPFQIGSGKGLTQLAAHVGAVGEAIERYSAARYRKDQLTYARIDELDGDVLDPRQLALYADEQYRRQDFPFPRFTPTKPIHWLRGSWFGTGDPVWMPALLAYFDFQPARGEYFCQVSSNGLAAGGDRQDAALRALMELVERDAFMLTWMCQLPATRVQLDDSLDAGGMEVVRQMTERGVAMEVYALDVGIGIPTMLCIGLGDGRSWPGACVSLSTHLDPRQAALKAILEQAHVGPYLHGLMHNQRIPQTPEEVHTLEDHALYYVPTERLTAFDFLRRDCAELPLTAFEGVEGEPLAACRARLDAAGVRVAIADVTSPDVAESPFRVARAIGTDMQPIHFGFALRRLANPRLHAHLGDKGLHPHPHPIA